MGDRRIGILGTGSFLPERVLTNFDLEKILKYIEFLKLAGLVEMPAAK